MDHISPDIKDDAHSEDKTDLDSSNTLTSSTSYVDEVLYENLPLELQQHLRHLLESKRLIIVPQNQEIKKLTGYPSSVADQLPNSQEHLNEERIQWENERSELLARLNALQCTHERTQLIDRSGNCACNGYASTQDSTNVSSLHDTQLERYENEIARLYRMLEDCRLKHNLGLTEEGFDAEHDTRSPKTSENDVTPPQHDPSAQLLLQSTPPATISELDWVRLNAAKNEIVLQSSSGCAMCKNYEQLLQEAHVTKKRNETTMEQQTEQLAEKSAELTAATQRLAELEEVLKGRSKSHADQIETLEASLDEMRTRVDNLMEEYSTHKQFASQQIKQLASECRSLKNSSTLLQEHYNALLGRRTKAAAELSAQPILLPNDKTELELLALKLHEENIALREAREHLDDRLERDAELHIRQLAEADQKLRHVKAELNRELTEASARLASVTDVVAQRDQEAAARALAEAQASSLNDQIIELQAKLAAAESETNNARSEVANLQQRLVCMQSDLDNAESVQKDFVQLSQNLQMQLEKLRQQEHEVRWVEPEDALDCFACHAVFPTGAAGLSQKCNCRHCGKVHCANCSRRTFPTPSGRVVRVCDVCHTLLNKHVAPFFSTASRDQFQPKPSHHSPLPWRRSSNVAARSESPSTTPAINRALNRSGF